MRIRQAPNLERGFNDGIALPFVLVFAALATFAAFGSAMIPQAAGNLALTHVLSVSEVGRNVFGLPILGGLHHDYQWTA